MKSMQNKCNFINRLLASLHLTDYMTTTYHDKTKLVRDRKNNLQGVTSIKDNKMYNFYSPTISTRIDTKCRSWEHPRRCRTRRSRGMILNSLLIFKTEVST